MTSRPTTREVTLQDLHDALFELRTIPASLSALQIELLDSSLQASMNAQQIQRLTMLVGELHEIAKRVEAGIETLGQDDKPTLPSPRPDGEP